MSLALKVNTALGYVAAKSRNCFWRALKSDEDILPQSVESAEMGVRYVESIAMAYQRNMPVIS